LSLEKNSLGARGERAALSYLKKKGEAQPPHAYQGQLGACADSRPYYEWLSDIEVPTLVIHGEDDLIWPVKNAETLKEGIGDNAQLYIMKESGHVFFQERPDEFNQKLLDFLRTNNHLKS